MPDEPETIEYKGDQVFKIGHCQVTVKRDTEGKAHFEADCLNKEARDELAAIFEQEAVLRINPKVILEDIAAEPKPDTRLNPTES